MPDLRIAVAPLLCELLALVGCGSGQEASDTSIRKENAPIRPDIILVSIDSLRYDHLGCYGYGPPTSPTLDRLAREGVRCECAVSTTSWTLPAHAALFTGLCDSTHGLCDNRLKLADAQRTLAEALHEQGYQTAGFFGGPYLHPIFGLGQGFDVYRSCMSAHEGEKPGDAVRDLLRAPEKGALRDVTGPRTVREVARWIDHADARPFFLFVHLWDVHYDYVPPPEYAQMFDRDYAGSLDASDLPHNPAIHNKMAPRDLQHLVALYDGEIRSADETVKEILAAIEKRGRLSNALTVITADHGEEFFEHGGKGHQRSLFEEVVRAPMIFHWPGHLDAGRVVKDQVRLIDVMPTLLALAGSHEKERVQGRDIGPLLRGERLDPAPALCELLVDGGEVRALRTREWIVMRYRGDVELAFDLARDPGEQTVLPDDSATLRTGLEDLRRAVDDARSFQKSLGTNAQPIDVDKDVERVLRGLGYTDNETAPAPRQPK